MATRLTLLCAAATASSRLGAFPSPGEPLDEGGARKANAFRLRGPRADLVLSSPCRAALETADALKLQARIEPLLADLDFGEWTGRTLADVHLATPVLLEEWLADPTRAPPGGEAMAVLGDRMRRVIDRLADQEQSTIIVTHAAPIRAAVAHALAMPLASAMRLDVAPLSATVLSHGRQWRLQELRRPGR